MKNEQLVDFQKRETIKLEDAQAGLQRRRCRRGAAASQRRVSGERSEGGGQRPGRGPAAGYREVCQGRARRGSWLQLRVKGKERRLWRTRSFSCSPSHSSHSSFGTAEQCSLCATPLSPGQDKKVATGPSCPKERKLFPKIFLKQHSNIC